jgi:hypothetical protein
VKHIDDDGDIWFDDDGGDEICISPCDAKLASENDSSSKNYAVSFIDTFVTYNRKKYKVTGWGCATSGYLVGLPKPILDIVKKSGYCYFVIGENFLAPASKITAISNRVVLNSEYTAIITKESVLVGCQTIPIEKVQEILKNHKDIHG